MLLRAFAKINLDLRVLGKRSDGFHEIRTTLQTIDWWDEMRIEPSSQFEFSANQGPQDETNLVVRAVRAFESASSVAANVHIALTKNVPAGAGLGGGSADAAVTFLGLQRFFDCDADRTVLRTVGSDVFFFTVGGRASASGRGDEIEPLGDDVSYWLVLAHAGIHIPTGEAYSWLAAHSELTVKDKSNSIEGFRVRPDPDSDAAKPRNDFEAPVFARYPRLQEIKTEFLRLGAFRSAMSGSGSVIYGQFRTKEDAETAAAELGTAYSVKVARPLSRAEYLSRMID